MSNKPEKHLYVREYIPPAEEPEEPYIDITNKRWCEDAFWDINTHICYYIFKEPEWIHMEKDKCYELEHVDYNDDDTYHYRLCLRLTDNLVLIAEDYGNGYIKTEEKYLGESWHKTTLEKWLKENYPHITIH